MIFKYKPVQVYKGWWKVTDLPIGITFKFDRRSFYSSSGRRIELSNCCELITYDGNGDYRVELDNCILWWPDQGSNPYQEVHIV